MYFYVTLNGVKSLFRFFADAQNDKKGKALRMTRGVRIATASVRTGFAMTKRGTRKDNGAKKGNITVCVYIIFIARNTLLC